MKTKEYNSKVDVIPKEGVTGLVPKFFGMSVTKVVRSVLEGR